MPTFSSADFQERPEGKLWKDAAREAQHYRRMPVLKFTVRTGRTEQACFAFIEAKLNTYDRLARAIAATFARRNTEIPSELPDGLTPAFAADAAKIQQWNAFAVDVAFAPGTLAKVVEDLAAFLMPHARAARTVLDPGNAAGTASGRPGNDFKRP